MTPRDMIDFAFRGPDDAELERFEREIAANPVLAATVDRLSRSIDLMLDDGEEIEPPADLTRRTVALVAAHRHRRSILDYVPATVPFRWGDLAVAASIFLAGLLTLLPAVHRSRLQADQTACAFNLGQLGQGLASYASTHGTYPYPPRSCPIPYAGIFKIFMHDSGHLDDPATLDCPSNGRARGRTLPDFDAMCKLHDRSPGDFHFTLCGDYAYNLGFRHESGQTGPALARPSARIPLLADGPGHDQAGRVFAGNSPNHGGSGQNVVFCDGHVGWFGSRALGLDPDMFLNLASRPEPGLKPHDAVLAPGNIPFFARPAR